VKREEASPPNLNTGAKTLWNIRDSSFLPQFFAAALPAKLRPVHGGEGFDS
jgi:hypothetical protein